MSAATYFARIDIVRNNDSQKVLLKAQLLGDSTRIIGDYVFAIPIPPDHMRFDILQLEISQISHNGDVV